MNHGAKVFPVFASVPYTPARLSLQTDPNNSLSPSHLPLQLLHDLFDPRQHKAMTPVKRNTISSAHLFPQCSHPLLEAHSLIRPILDQ